MKRQQAEFVHDDYPCAKCGYSLRTLRMDGMCPECGYSVAESLLSAEDRLVLLAEERVMAAKPAMIRWRKRMLVTTVAGVIAFIVGPFIGQYVVPDQSPRDQFDLAFLLWAIVVYSALFVSIASLLAWYGCDVRLEHTKHVEEVKRGGDSSRDERSRRRDDRIARREDIYRRNIGAAKALAVLAIMAVTCMAATTFAFFDDRTLAIKPPFVIQIVSMIHWIVIVSILIWINTGRLAHAQSIRFRRRLERARQD